MNLGNFLSVMVIMLTLFGFQYSGKAATAAGAGIELDGKYIGGYTITWDKESRAKLASDLSQIYITFERDFKIPVDQKNKNIAVLKGKIRILSKVRGDRIVEGTAESLKLVKKKNRWYADPESLKKALAVKKKD